MRQDTASDLHAGFRDPCQAVPLRPAPRAACDHGAPAGWRLQSEHETSAGTVAYARCPCGRGWCCMTASRWPPPTLSPAPPPRRCPASARAAVAGCGCGCGTTVKCCGSGANGSGTGRYAVRLAAVHDAGSA
jgi:hypothetical protein